MFTRAASLLLLLFSMITATAASTAGADAPAGAAWTETQFLGAPAWQSRQGAQLAIVSVARCRLLYLGAADGSRNLLSAPATPPPQDADNQAPNWGGHRFWLGPQARWVWPPLTDWEFTAAASVRVDGPTLILQHPAANKAYPALTREYAWEGQRLRCTVRWRDDSRAYYGMHVVAVDAPAEVHASLSPTPSAPEGAVGVRIDGYDTSGVLAHPAVTVSGAALTLRSGSPRNAKLGLVPQPITCTRRGGWTLVMSPGPSTGTPIGTSDAGHLTQVWVGQPAAAFAELEQLSPLLLGGKDGNCSSTCYLQALSP